ncbi:hypothetical protein [Turicimonas sp. TL08]
MTQEENQKREERLKTRKRLPEKLDFENPLKLSPEMLPPKRTRGSVASRLQMLSIAADPDYLRLSGERSFEAGAPVVAFGEIEPSQLGKIDWVIFPDGTKSAAQYAVVETDKVLTAYDLDGKPDEDYFSEDVSKFRVLAGHARVNAVKLAYLEGTSSNYLEDLYSDEVHGINRGSISKITAPILVRILPPKEVTAELWNQKMVPEAEQGSAAEQAECDARLIAFESIETYSDGSPTQETLMEFIRKLPVHERSGLVDESGSPTWLALNRFKSAVFAKTYEHKKLTELYCQALDPESRVIIDALEVTAFKLQKLHFLNNRNCPINLIAEAGVKAISTLTCRQDLSTSFNSEDLFVSPDRDERETAIMKIFADHIDNPQAIAEQLKRFLESS